MCCDRKPDRQCGGIVRESAKRATVHPPLYRTVQGATLYFREQLRKYKNYRNGPYHTGMYTVSAHVPMGQNVGASADGRFAQDPLADGGLSDVYGRDIQGPMEDC